MKASGSFNPITESAGGSYEYERSDYQEGRKTTLFYLVIVVGVIVVAFFLMKNAITSMIPSLSGAGEAVSTAVKKANQDSIDTVVRAAGATPGPVMTEKYWDAAKRYLGESAISTTAISAGNVILSTPIINNLGQPLLKQATIAGQDFRQDLDSYADYERLEDDPLKGLIVTGEGISRTFFGLSPYEAGKATSAWLQSFG